MKKWGLETTINKVQDGVKYLIRSGKFRNWNAILVVPLKGQICASSNLSILRLFKASYRGIWKSSAMSAARENYWLL